MVPGEDGDPKAHAPHDPERLLPLARLADIGRLAASVAHEISTPLASITLRAESLARSAQDPRLQAIESFKNFPRYLKSIEEEALRCKEILARLMDFARTPAAEPRSVDLNALAERAGQLMRHEMMRRRVSLDFRPQPDLPRLEGWEGRLGQAMLALLLGALDAAAEGETVTLETSTPRADAASVRVGPMGDAVSMEDTLVVCRAVAAAHGGEATVETGASGTRVALVLPLRGRT